MKAPGFTAEAALYAKHTNYRMSQTRIKTGGGVELAFFRCSGQRLLATSGVTASTRGTSSCSDALATVVGRTERGARALEQFCF